MTILKYQEEFDAAIRTHSIVIVQFGADSCAPCKALQNRIEVWNRAHPEIDHIYLPVADFRELCAQLGVFTVPTIFVYVEGKLALRQSGFFSLDEMLQQIEKYQRLLAE